MMTIIIIDYNKYVGGSALIDQRILYIYMSKLTMHVCGTMIDSISAFIV